jgi:uncharacterized membrane protein
VAVEALTAGLPYEAVMASRNPESTAQVAGHPIHPMLIPFPVAFLVATLVSDLVFLRTGNPGWATASLWLLGAALVMAALAAAAGLIDFLGDERIRDLSAAWHHMIGNVIAVVLALINWYRRYAATEPGIPSGGVVLSLLVVLILLYTGWRGWEMVYKHRVAVSDQP